MSDQYTVICPSTALVAATAKTLIELATPSDGDNVVIGFDIAFDGVTASAVPVKVEWITYTTTGTGSAYTPNRVGQNQGKAAKTTAKNALTVEGSGSITVIGNWFVPPTSGLSYLFPLGRELGMTISKFMGLRVTAPAVVNAMANIWIEE